MTTALQNAFADARSRRDGFRAAASRALSTKAAGGSTPYGGDTVGRTPFGNQDIADAAKQYKAIKRDWPYVTNRPVATKIAGQSFRVGQKPTAAPAGPAKLRTKAANSLVLKFAPDFIRKEISEGIETINDHLLLDAFDSPNPFTSGWALKYCIAMSVQATGKAYIWIDDTRDESGNVTSVRFWYLPATWVTPIHTESRPFAGWKVRPPGSPDNNEPPVPFEKICYIAYPDPADPLAAMSPLQTQARAVNTDEEIQKAQYSLMMNGMRPGVVMKVGTLPPPPGSGIPAAIMPRPSLTPEQRQQLIMAARMACSGAMHYGDPFIVDGMIEDVMPWTLSAVDLDFPNGSQLTKDRIMQGTGTSPLIAGQVEGATRAGSYVAQENFYSNVVNPIITLISESLTKWLAPLFPVLGQKFYAWIDEAKAFDADLEITKMEMGIKARVVTKNQLLEFLNLPPLEDDAGNEFCGAEDLEVAKLAATPPPPTVGTQRPAGASRNPNAGRPPRKATDDLLLKYDGQPRDPVGRFTGYFLTAGEVMDRIKASPQFTDSKIDWDAYAARWAVVGEFAQVEVPIVAIAKLRDTGQLGTSGSLSDDDIAAKVESGRLNPIIISRPAAERAPLYVLDGTHSLSAAYRRYIAAGDEESRNHASMVRAIVSMEAAAMLGIDFGE